MQFKVLFMARFKIYTANNSFRNCFYNFKKSLAKEAVFGIDG